MRARSGDSARMLTSVLQVALGGALGAVARYLVGIGMSRATGPGFPLSVLTVNVLGSFLMGVFVVVAAQRALIHLSPLIQTGFLGGFTTFSSFSLDAMQLIERGEIGQAALYVLLSVGASIGALFCGLMLARGGFA